MLLGLTTVSFELSSIMNGRALMFVILALTIIKGQLVARDFMGLRKVRPLWRHIMTSYLLIINGLIAIAYLTT
ncbi:MAG: cytochrome C oxidase subunit IV family protein [Halothiobacillus sp.]